MPLRLRFFFASLVLALGLFASSPVLAQAVWPPPSTGAPPAAKASDLADLKAGGSFGVGVMVGSRNGLSMRIWPRRAFAFDIGLGTSWLLNSVSADATFRFSFAPARNNQGTVAAVFSTGAGLRAQVYFSEDSFVELGVRVPLGISILVAGWKVEPFVEAAPVVVFLENFGVQVEGVVGARYYF